jgi:hypothetical protein
MLKCDADNTFRTFTRDEPHLLLNHRLVTHALKTDSEHNSRQFTERGESRFRARLRICEKQRRETSGHEHIRFERKRIFAKASSYDSFSRKGRVGEWSSKWYAFVRLTVNCHSIITCELSSRLIDYKEESTSCEVPWNSYSFCCSPSVQFEGSAKCIQIDHTF